jgi:hypothetical protein
MTTPAIRVLSSQVTQALGAIGNNGYSAAMRIQVSAQTFANPLFADFRIPAPTFGGSPTSGVVQLIAVDRDFSGTAGTAPSATSLGRFCGTFNPIFTGTATPGIMYLDFVPLSPDADYYVFNNGTAFSIATGLTMTAQCWSPGT